MTQPVILLRLAKRVPACWDDWAIWVSCVGMMTHPGLCPIAQETASAAPMLCPEFGPDGFGFFFWKPTFVDSTVCSVSVFLLCSQSQCVIRSQWSCILDYSIVKKIAFIILIQWSPDKRLLRSYDREHLRSNDCTYFAVALRGCSGRFSRHYFLPFIDY